MTVHIPLFHTDRLCCSASPELLELYWSTLCVTLCSFIIMCYYVYVSSYVLLVNPYVLMCPHMFFIDGIYLLFICYLFLQLCIICVHFCDLHVYLTYAGMWAICVFHKIHYFDSKFAGYRVFWLFTCLSVCVFCVLCVFWFYTIYFFPHICRTVFPPFALWFDLGFCVNFGGVGSIVYIYIYINILIMV